ncbi:MAG: bifunctional phosphoglucose/phosphomannose isomerase [Bacteroidetes bacterium]|nr:bifunctional phosphoglucose/phosphomannose isomerase [Rhodothermia bacterium]MCS7155792.1 bifunctional phosphoglucose/phosphomannose isomerase [Bacteroidota bacterium]MCX7906107.1 bifunctional phosphoglucose/phosphomannose isomerase [Bacteroidota bacterium]MDW8138235.1 bifunctional phosphoglucose/phosphomannose isomerase [Bacteroidota bacterium]MDW8285919.1 bifunctional phosphoglucose/phosphomannose isomerase [Bacteroidota bacterium]
MSVDQHNMHGILCRFPEDWSEAHALATEALADWLPSRPVHQVLVAGMGGSAIGGDLLRAYLRDRAPAPILVCRHYSVPTFVGPHTLVLVCSYSGQTEETLSAYEQAVAQGAQVLVVSSGGRAAELAARYGHRLVRIPPGRPPRTALAYLFAPLLHAAWRAGLCADPHTEIAETAQLLEAHLARYAHASEHNPAVRLAQALFGKLPILYAGHGPMEAVALRWRGQLAENAKVLAYGHVLPEMNHNEIVGWQNLPELLRQMAVVFLHDPEDHPRVRQRMRITRRLIQPHAASVHDLYAEGQGRLARMLGLIYLGDWTSYYLALLYEVDPTPVAKIDLLKAELASWNAEA